MDALMTARVTDILKLIAVDVAFELVARPQSVIVTVSFSSDPGLSYLEISHGINHTRTSPFEFTDLMMEPSEFRNRFINPAVCRLRAL